MSTLLAEYLSRLSDSYEYYYDVEREPEGCGLPLCLKAEFHARDEGYVLLKSARIWGAESNEYIYVFSAPEFDADTVGRCVDHALADGLPKVEPHPEHKDSYIIAVFVADVISPEAEAVIRSRKFYRSFALGLKGWVNLKTAGVALEKELVCANKMGKDLVKHFKTLIRSEKV